MKKMVIVENGMVDFEDAVFFMDDEIREELHAEMAPCTDQEFFDAYCEKHAEKYDEDFVEAHCCVKEIEEDEE